MTERKKGRKGRKGEEKKAFCPWVQKYNLKLFCRVLHNDYWGDISFYKILFPSFVVCVHARACVCDFAISFSLAFCSSHVILPQFVPLRPLVLCPRWTQSRGATDAHSPLAEIVLCSLLTSNTWDASLVSQKLSNFSCFYLWLSANGFLWLCDFWSPHPFLICIRTQSTHETRSVASFSSHSSVGCQVQ